MYAHTKVYKVCIRVCVMEQLRFRRKQIVSKIYSSIQQASARGLEIDRKKLISEVCLNYGCARRTAIEYICDAYFLFSSHHSVEPEVEGG